MIEEIKKFLKATKHVLGQTAGNAVKHEVPLHGAAIAFYTIFSIAPLLILMVMLANILLSETMIRQELYIYLESLTGPQMTESLQQMIDSSNQLPTETKAFVITIGTLIFAATTAISQLKASLDHIAEVSEPDSNAILLYVLNRLSSFVLILIFTGLFVASLLLEGTVIFFTDFLDRLLPDLFSPFIQWVTSLLNVGISVLFFGILLRFAPSVKLPLKHILAGACFTALLFIIGKYLIGLYLGNEAIRTSYRAAGSFVVFIIWMYYNVQIVLLGAEFTFTYSRYKHQNIDELKVEN